MPKAGMSMEEGVVIRWLKSPGQRVAAGEPLLEIETDKVSMEVEAPASGFLLGIVHGEGDTVPVTETIGWIGEADEDIPAGRSASAEPAGPTVRGPAPERRIGEALAVSGRRIPATPAARRIANERGLDLSGVTPSGSLGQILARDVRSAATVRITPLARAVAGRERIDLRQVRGSGPRGRITKKDVLDRMKALPLHEPLSGSRARIAERMEESHRTIPPVTLETRVDVTDLMEFRARLNRGDGTKISVNDLVLRAAAAALSDHRRINSWLEDGEIVLHRGINLGFAVALDEGLIVPVVHDAGPLSLRELAAKTADLAARARAGRLSPDDVSGATFTVTNLGMYGITSFTPMIDPPQCAILGVCAIGEELRMMNETITSRRIMTLALTIDHRAIDGAAGALFLGSLKELLETPARLS